MILIFPTKKMSGIKSTDLIEERGIGHGEVSVKGKIDAINLFILLKEKDYCNLQESEY